jgi:hypothetical protein
MSHNEGVSMEDETTLEELRALVARMDPVPEQLDEAAQSAYTWRTIDAELAELMRDSAEAADESALALRSATVGPRMLSFETPRVAIEAEVSVTGPRTRRLVGQIIPPVAATMTLEQGGLRLESVADELGRFRFDGLGAGPARLRAALPGGGMEIATPWTSL